MNTNIDHSRIPLQCLGTIAPERGWGVHFDAFTVILSTLTLIRRHCSLKCGKGLLLLADLFCLSLLHFALHNFIVFLIIQCTTDHGYFIQNMFCLHKKMNFKSIKWFIKAKLINKLYLCEVKSYM